MSFRALRKVLKQKELAEAKELEAELLEAEEEEEKEAQVARKQNLVGSELSVCIKEFLFT